MTSGIYYYKNPYDLVFGSTIMETTGSQTVNCIDPETYQIAETGEALHKIKGQNPRKTGLYAARFIILFSAVGTVFIIAYVLMLLFRN